MDAAVADLLALALRNVFHSMNAKENIFASVTTLQSSTKKVVFVAVVAASLLNHLHRPLIHNERWKDNLCKKNKIVSEADFGFGFHLIWHIFMETLVIFKHEIISRNNKVASLVIL